MRKLFLVILLALFGYCFASETIVETEIVEEYKTLPCFDTKRYLKEDDNEFDSKMEKLANLLVDKLTRIIEKAPEELPKLDE